MFVVWKRGFKATRMVGVFAPDASHTPGASDASGTSDTMRATAASVAPGTAPTTFTSIASIA